MISLQLHKLPSLIFLSLFSAACLAQVPNPPSACPSPQAVLQRYTDAVGGPAVNAIQTRVMTAKETNSGFGTEHYIYKFKWKAPNKVIAGSTPYLFGTIPVSYPNGTFIFDGEGWSDFDRRKSRNEERDPLWQRKLRHQYLYNEDPQFLEFRVLTDPLVLAHADGLYSSYDLDTDPTNPPQLCVLRANGIDQWRRSREDTLFFDAKTGLLKTWKLQSGTPRHKSFVQFQFGDYRRLDSIQFPFKISFDLYDAVFQFTSVVQNKPLPDSDFEEKPERQ